MAGRGLMVLMLVLALAAGLVSAQTEVKGPVLGPPPALTGGLTPRRSPEPMPPPPKTISQGETPVVVVETLGPSTLNAGRPLTIEVIVRNKGTGPAFQVRVEEEIPAAAKFVTAEPPAEIRENKLSWSLDMLEAGATKRLKFELLPAEEGDLLSKAVVTFSTSASLTTKITRPKLRLKKSGPDVVALGEGVTFRIEITNVGTGPATGVVIRDQLPPAFQHPQGDSIEADIGTLGPGESKSITLAVKAATPGVHTNEVLATGDDGLRASASTVVRVGQPALKLTKTGPPQRFLNTDAVFFLEVSNPGDAPARKVQLLDALPEGVHFVEASDGGRFDKDSQSVQWQFETLLPGEKRRVSLKALAAKVGDWKNQAVATADLGLNQKANVLLKIVGVPALLLEVVDRDDPVEVGQETCYEIRVLNQGSSASTNVHIMASVPEGLTPTRAEADVPHKIQGKQIIFDVLSRLAPKADAVYRVYVRADEPGDYRFKVQLNSDQLRIPVCEEESTKAYRD